MTTLSPSFVEKTYTTSTLCAVAGCKASDFRTWRNRYLLFPETIVRGTNKTPWNLFSVIDVCVVRTISELIKAGCKPKSAIEFCDTGARLQFMMMTDENYLDADLSNAAIGFGSSEDGDTLFKNILMLGGDDDINYIRAKSENKSVGIFIDLHVIITHVLDELIALKPEAIGTKADAIKVVAQALAQGLSPQDEGAADD